MTFVRGCHIEAVRNRQIRYNYYLSVDKSVLKSVAVSVKSCKKWTITRDDVSSSSSSSNNNSCGGSTTIRITSGGVGNNPDRCRLRLCQLNPDWCRLRLCQLDPDRCRLRLCQLDPDRCRLHLCPLDPDRCLLVVSASVNWIQIGVVCTTV